MMELCGESIKSCDDVVEALRKADDVEHARSGVVSAIHVYGDRVAGLLACALVCLARDKPECDGFLCGGTLPFGKSLTYADIKNAVREVEENDGNADMSARSKYLLAPYEQLQRLAARVPESIRLEGWEAVVTRAIGCLLQQERWIESEVRRELEQLRGLREQWQAHGEQCLEAVGVGCGSSLSIIEGLVEENKRLKAEREEVPDDPHV